MSSCRGRGRAGAGGVAAGDAAGLREVQARDARRKGAKTRLWLHSVDQTARGWRDSGAAVDEERSRDTLSKGAGRVLSAGEASNYGLFGGPSTSEDGGFVTLRLRVVENLRSRWPNVTGLDNVMSKKTRNARVPTVQTRQREGHKSANAGDLACGWLHNSVLKTPLRCDRDERVHVRGVWG